MTCTFSASSTPTLQTETWLSAYRTEPRSHRTGRSGPSAAIGQSVGHPIRVGDLAVFRMDHNARLRSRVVSIQL